ncbi:Protein kinase C substrate 80K-H [Nesidiocoris tenuis]|uniref:Protein kinase C substrate 80K-H n=1 Tax=Nesidiocoris tenuis TaxID=355587 RepID=A0ABN7AI11_9HEMI|nr:Protein kinase C substrate 80K-H [Nesidiocoris tenuis]
MEIRCNSLKKRTIKSISLLIGGVGLVFVCYQLMMAQLMEESEIKLDGGVHGIVHNKKIINLKRSRVTSYLDDEVFLCGDGLTISHAKVNDDYCDCSDGSDEPDTDACSGLSYFECHFRFKKFKIPSSWVNDGICDCCDGSDEKAARKSIVNLNLTIQKKTAMFLTPCPNYCPR